jgi:hypothetical protein
MSNEKDKKELPSQEQVISWYKEQIELAKLRAELAQLQKDAAVADAQRLQAVRVIAQIQSEQPGADESDEDQDEAPSEAKTATLTKTK